MMAANRLIVEGKQDRQFIKGLQSRKVFDFDVEITALGGKDKIIEKLPALLKTSGTKKVGVILDADKECRDSYRLACRAFKKADIDLPSKLPKSGLVHQSSDLKIGIWIAPDNNRMGDMEEFILDTMFDTKHRILKHAQNTIASCPNHNSRFVAKDRSKATLGTVLSLLDAPDDGIEAAIGKKYLEVDMKTFRPFVDWLTQTFA